jgi:hypothetical protein
MHEPPLIVSTIPPPDELPGLERLEPGCWRARDPTTGAPFRLNPRPRGTAGAAGGYERDLREPLAVSRTMIPEGRT